MSGGAGAVAGPGDFYLVSAAGLPNYGDDYITRAWLQFLAERHPDRTVWLDCPEPGRAALLHRATHPGLRTVNTLWQLAGMMQSNSVDEIVHQSSVWVEHGGTPRQDPGLDLLREVRSIHLLGGGYLNSLWSNNYVLPAVAVAVARQSGGLVFATGQGIVPVLPGDGAAIRALFSAMTFAEVRDRASAAALGIRVGLDDAFLVPEHRESRGEREDLPDAMILLQGDFDLGGPAAIRGLVESFLARAEVDPSRVGFVEGLPPDDFAYLDEVRAVVPDVRLFSFQNLWDEGLPVKPGQKWLTSRFHFHLLAAAKGAAGVSVAAEPDYYGNKHSSLVDLGTGWNLVDARDLSADLTPRANRRFVARVAGLRRRKLKLAEGLYPAG